MPASVRTWSPVAFLKVARLIIPLLIAASAPALADGVYLPPAPTGPGGEDVVETSDGARCRQSMNSSGAYMDVGLSASGSSRDSRGQGYILPGYGGDGGGSQQALGYARVTLPLGHRPQRLDCSRLYELEIARMKREIELLKMAAE
jgi:hypothetical protein